MWWKHMCHQLSNTQVNSLLENNTRTSLWNHNRIKCRYINSKLSLRGFVQFYLRVSEVRNKDLCISRLPYEHKYELELIFQTNLGLQEIWKSQLKQTNKDKLKIKPKLYSTKAINKISNKNYFDTFGVLVLWNCHIFGPLLASDYLLLCDPTFWRIIMKWY